MFETRVRTVLVATVIVAGVSGTALAQKKYDTGATDTEIKVGNLMPYSGPALME
jgi:branched-chain amino acid transport system substrate-binding protein